MSYWKSVHGDKRVDISGDDGRREFRYQDTSNSYCHNCVESVDDYGRDLDRYHTSHSHSNNPSGSGILLCLYIASRPVHKFFHGDEIGDISGDGGRGGFRYQETSHYFFRNCWKSISVDEKGGYISHIRSSPSHNKGCLSGSLVFSVLGDERGAHRYHTSHLTSHNHGGRYRSHPRLKHDDFHRGVRGDIIKSSHQWCLLYPHQNHPCYTYASMSPHPHLGMPPLPICPFPYCTCSSIYALYVVTHHPHITFLFIYIIHHPVFFAPPCHQTYFLLIIVLVFKGVDWSQEE